MDKVDSFDLIQSHFALFPGIGPKLEALIWSYGITTWDKMLSFKPDPLHPWLTSRLPHPDRLKEAIVIWQKELSANNFSFFADGLSNLNLWLLWKRFPNKFCFLDIETTGIDIKSVMTVVSLYMKGEMFTFQRGVNLEYLLDHIEKDMILVSYNGRRFDVPFIERELQQTIPNHHLDLMNVLHEMGIKGGLKKSEIILGLKRSEEVVSIDGSLAPRLWYDYIENGNLRSLDLLVAYNQEDTKNLALVLDEVFIRKKNLFKETYLTDQI